MEHFAMHTNPAPIGAFSVKFLRAGIAVVQHRAVLQRIYERIYDMPKLVAHGGTQLAYDERIALFTKFASASALRDCQLYLFHCRYPTLQRTMHS